MSLWDDVSKTASDAASYTVKKAGELTSSAKIKYKMHLAETKLSCTYEGIGRLYYNAVMLGENNTETISELLADVTEINAEIAKYKSQLADIQNKCLCPRCGASIPEGSTFCSSCGARLK